MCLQLCFFLLLLIANSSLSSCHHTLFSVVPLCFPWFLFFTIIYAIICCMYLCLQSCWLCIWHSLLCHGLLIDSFLVSLCSFSLNFDGLFEDYLGLQNCRWAYHGGFYLQRMQLRCVIHISLQIKKIFSPLTEVVLLCTAIALTDCHVLLWIFSLNLYLLPNLKPWTSIPPSSVHDSNRRNQFAEKKTYAHCTQKNEDFTSCTFIGPFFPLETYS